MPIVDHLADIAPARNLGSGFPWAAVIIGIVVVLVAIGLLLYFRRRR